MKIDQITRAENFRRLHQPHQPFVLFNVWDAGSARTVAMTGAQAIATSSWSLAAAQGFDDGEKISWEGVLATLTQIVKSVELPLTADLESGFGAKPSDVARNISAAIEIGAVGFNIEDGLTQGGIRAIADQIERLHAASLAIRKSGCPAFLNARIDYFLQNSSEKHQHLMPEALQRIQAYTDAGADGIFVPGLMDTGLIEVICKASSSPVNVMVSAETVDIVKLARAGVARVSYGPSPYIAAMKALEISARQAFSAS